MAQVLDVPLAVCLTLPPSVFFHHHKVSSYQELTAVAQSNQLLDLNMIL